MDDCVYLYWKKKWNIGKNILSQIFQEFHLFHHTMFHQYFIVIATFWKRKKKTPKIFLWLKLLPEMVHATLSWAKTIYTFYEWVLNWLHLLEVKSMVVKTNIYLLEWIFIILHSAADLEILALKIFFYLSLFLRCIEDVYR